MKRIAASGGVNCGKQIKYDLHHQGGCERNCSQSKSRNKFRVVITSGTSGEIFSEKKFDEILGLFLPLSSLSKIYIFQGCRLERSPHDLCLRIFYKQLHRKYNFFSPTKLERDITYSFKKFICIFEIKLTALKRLKHIGRLHIFSNCTCAHRSFICLSSQTHIHKFHGRKFSKMLISLHANKGLVGRPEINLRPSSCSLWA